MGVNSSKIFTKVLSGVTLNITSDLGLRNVSMVLISGTGSYIGDLKVDGLVSDSIPLVIGQAVSLGVEGSQILDGLDIDATGGIIHLIAKN
jgi:hypothetical protein